MDQLGQSLDQKIDTFLKLLMTLKSLKSHQDRPDSTLVQLIDSLVSTISRIVHELTEDTRILGEIKANVEEAADHGSGAKNGIQMSKGKNNDSSFLDLPMRAGDGSRQESKLAKTHGYYRQEQEALEI